MAFARPRPRRRKPSPEELRRAAPGASAETEAEPARAGQMPAYLGGPDAAPRVPLLSHGGRAARAEATDEEEGAEGAGPAREEEGANDAREVNALPNVSGGGEREEVVAHGRTLRLEGKTDASFSDSFRTVDVVTERGKGCKGCGKGGCVHVTGTVESTFTVSTNVTLPSVPGNLSECQKQRVGDAINNVLAPHEQEHVNAFNDYNGTVSTPFDMTICGNAFDARIRALHNAEEKPRRAAVKAASKALDPFFFDVDLDCEDKTSALEPEHTDAGARNPEEEETA